MDLINRIKYMPRAIKSGLDMGVSKRGIMKGKHCGSNVSL